VSNDNNDPFELDDLGLPEPMGDASLGDDAFGPPLGDDAFDSPLDGGDSLESGLDFAPLIEEDEPSSGKKGKKKGKAKAEKTKGKKEKTPKGKKDKEPAEKRPKKSKTPKKSKSATADDGGGMPILAICGVMLLGLVGLDIYVVLSYFQAAAMFFVLLIVMNILGLVAVSVPYFCWTVRRTISIYEVCLGLAVVALVIGSAALIIELTRYGGQLEPTASIQIEQFDDISVA